MGWLDTPLLTGGNRGGSKKREKKSGGMGAESGRLFLVEKTDFLYFFSRRNTYSIDIGGLNSMKSNVFI